MNRKQLIKTYLDFFKKKNHVVIANASLIPANDPTVLFTTAGMHPLVPYLLGEKHPLGKRLVNVQKCIRTQDIDEVGDNIHLTFFEMLGNWSLGDYFKKDAIQFSFEFLTKTLKIPVEKLAASVFGGDKLVPQIPKDEESAQVWLSLGIPRERIAFLRGGVLESEKNWWGPAGKTGPCGPDTEMFFWKGKEKPPKQFNPDDKNWVEIWNDVLMQYEKTQRILLVDGMFCLYNKYFKINEELLHILNSINVRKILIVNGYTEKARELLKNTNFEIFSLEKEGIKKENQDYFKKLMKEFNLSSEELLYFDHAEENINSAEKLGITSELYKNNKIIKKFIEDNLYVYKPASQKNIDTGMGVERTVAVLNGKEDVYETDCFLPVIQSIEKISKKKYSDEKNKKSMRIIADHVKASVFIIADGVVPGNVEQGYVLRRLIRRAVRHGRELGISNFLKPVAEPVFEIYEDYPEILKNKKTIIDILEKEEEKFLETLEKGIIAFHALMKDKKKISGKDAFLLYQSYGFPLEMMKELALERKIYLDEQGFYQEEKKHQKLSRTASEGKFKSGLADYSEQTVKLHTATHLLNEALRKILGEQVKQRGSNITPERLRFDFSFPRKLTHDEIKNVEDLVNKKIKENLTVVREEMSLENAFKLGAQAEFGHKYPSVVSVYTILDDKEKKGWFSKEICTGPHVKKTGEIGKFKIVKEEASSLGVRRIKAVVE